VPQQELVQARRDGRATDERYHARRDGSVFYGSGVTIRLGTRSDLGFAKIARDLTAQAQAAEALAAAHSALEVRVAERTSELAAEVKAHKVAQSHVVKLLRTVVTAQEDERSRIARNLHDQLGQRLTALRLSLERLESNDAQAATTGAVDEALAMVQAIDAEVGFLAWELRPAILDHLGLAVALPRYIQEWSEHYRVEGNYSGTLLQKLPGEVEIALYRIVQEALTNVAKHAHATRADVLLETRGDTVVLVVEDDGVGFDVEHSDTSERGIGVMGMRERAELIGAEFQLESRPGGGTSVYVRYTPGRTHQDAASELV
jgi:signal transduction histidine kinase